LLIGASSNHNNNQQSSSSSTKRVATILDDIFSFQFRSRITCSNCGRLSDTIENTNTWPIDVKVKARLSVISIFHSLNFSSYFLVCERCAKRHATLFT
jgi:uncharacterized UBP type Zn finger protein